jgi:hypothetical protein
MAGRAPASAHVAIIDAANRAFVAGLSRGSLVCAGVVALGAAFAFLVLPRRLLGAPPGPPTAPGSKSEPMSSAKSGAMKYVMLTGRPQKVRIATIRGGACLLFPGPDILLEDGVGWRA